MSTNVKAQAAWDQAQRYAAECKANPLGFRVVPPQVEYAMRRIGGMNKLPNSEERFAQAYNEAPIVDADENTFGPEILVRPPEPKDGIE